MNLDSKNSFPLSQWHRFALEKDASVLEELLASDVKLKSPFYWKPKEGRPVVALVLKAVLEILQNFRYEREWLEEKNWALEFNGTIGELELKGIDLIRLNHEGKISEIEVMIRPATALQALIKELDQRIKQTT